MSLFFFTFPSSSFFIFLSLFLLLFFHLSLSDSTATCFQPRPSLYCPFIDAAVMIKDDPGVPELYFPLTLQLIEESIDLQIEFNLKISDLTTAGISESTMTEVESSC
jgi:hypothetical protein